MADDEPVSPAPPFDGLNYPEDVDDEEEEEEDEDDDEYGSEAEGATVDQLSDGTVKVVNAKELTTIPEVNGPTRLSK